MNASRSFFSLSRISIATLLLCGAITALAQEPPSPSPAASKEMRERMAAMHEKMAACLRSDRALSECRQEMHQTCSSMMGEQGCPMMGMGNPGRMMPPPKEN